MTQPPLKRPGPAQEGGPADYPGGKTDYLAQRVEELRLGLAKRDPYNLARCTGALYQPTGQSTGEFSLKFWDTPLRMSFPDWRIWQGDPPTQPGTLAQALLAYYFTTADGTPLQGQWISFAELPGGRFYARAYQGYTGAELARGFGMDLAAFETAARSAGGFRLSIGDCSFSYQMLPLVSLAVVYWLGDDEFPSTCQVLFDAAAAHHLPADACAIAGSMLARRILKAHS